MPIEQFTFEGALGHELAGVLERPHGRARALALFAHCFTCGKDLKGAYWVSKALVERGVAVFRFDFTGLGESKGEFAETNFTSNLGDLRAAIDALRERAEAPQILIGHSLGGAAVLKVAGEIDEVQAVATIGAPSDTLHLAETLQKQAPELSEKGEVEVVLGGRKLRLRKQLVDDLSRGHLEEGLDAMGKALLVLHSPVDKIVSIEHARKIYQAAAHPKSFVSLDDADHLLGKERDARYAADIIASWAERYLPAAGEDDRPRLDEGQVLATGPGVGFVTRVYTKHHVLTGDEPERVGGTNNGPTPYDLLLASLGTCTNMTLRMYARRKGWPLEGVDVRLEHDRVHAEDCSECEEREGRVERLSREIVVHGPLSDEQKERLVEIANRCPVHRTLESDPLITTKLVESVEGE